jgi:hypothetical protein
MRLTRIFLFLVILGSSAAATYAQTDPVILNNDPAAPSCPAAPAAGVTYTDTLIIVNVPGADATATVNENFTQPLPIIYCPTSSPGDLLASITEYFNNVPASDTLFGSQSNIWQDSLLSGPSDGIEELVLSGTAGPCHYDDGADTCTGLAPGEVDYVSISPEPNSMILFGTGLIILLFVASKRGASTCARIIT